MSDAFQDKDLREFYDKKQEWKGCFGGMVVLSHAYLTSINVFYPLHILLEFVKTRYNRSSFERVIAVLLQMHNKQPSLLGNIHKYCTWGVPFSMKNTLNHLPIIKVWTGR